jgi:hypothetical protein
LRVFPFAASVIPSVPTRALFTKICAAPGFKKSGQTLAPHSG